MKPNGVKNMYTRCFPFCLVLIFTTLMLSCKRSASQGGGSEIVSATKDNKPKPTKASPSSAVNPWTGRELDTVKEPQKSKEMDNNTNGPRDLTNADVEVLEVRIKPFKTATGIDTVVICVDWKNKGQRAIRAVDASIIGYDAEGNEIKVLPVADYTIYATSNDETGVAPGQTYRVPDGEGYIVMKEHASKLVKAAVKITKVEEKGF